jgi:hypothetical protein
MKLTAKEINKKYKDKYIQVDQTYDYTKQEFLYEIKSVYKDIHEDTCLGQDIGTELAYKR